jgi:hypothetical protein
MAAPANIGFSIPNPNGTITPAAIGIKTTL